MEYKILSTSTHSKLVLWGFGTFCYNCLLPSNLLCPTSGRDLVWEEAIVEKENTGSKIDAYLLTLIYYALDKAPEDISKNLLTIIPLHNNPCDVWLIHVVKLLLISYFNCTKNWTTLTKIKSKLLFEFPFMLKDKVYFMTKAEDSQESRKRC